MLWHHKQSELADMLVIIGTCVEPCAGIGGLNGMSWLAVIVLTVVGNVVSTLITDAIHRHRDQKKWRRKRRR